MLQQLLSPYLCFSPSLVISCSLALFSLLLSLTLCSKKSTDSKEPTPSTSSVPPLPSSLPNQPPATSPAAPAQINKIAKEERKKECEELTAVKKIDEAKDNSVVEQKSGDDADFNNIKDALKDKSSRKSKKEKLEGNEKRSAESAKKSGKTEKKKVDTEKKSTEQDGEEGGGDYENLDSFKLKNINPADLADPKPASTISKKTSVVSKRDSKEKDEKGSKKSIKEGSKKNTVVESAPAQIIAPGTPLNKEKVVAKDIPQDLSFKAAPKGVSAKPTAILWPYETGQDSFKLINKSGDMAAYRIRSSDDNIYSANPTSGIIEDNSSLVVTVLRKKGPFKSDFFAVSYILGGDDDAAFENEKKKVKTIMVKMSKK